MHGWRYSCSILHPWFFINKMKTLNSIFLLLLLIFNNYSYAYTVSPTYAACRTRISNTALNPPSIIGTYSSPSSACASLGETLRLTTSGNPCQTNTPTWDCSDPSGASYWATQRPTPTTCTNGTMSDSTCTCNSGNFDTGSSCEPNVTCTSPQVRDPATNTCTTPPPPQENQQTCEAQGKVFNSVTGNCDEPPKFCSMAKGKETIRRITTGSGCINGKNCSENNDLPPSFDCVDNCEYDRGSGASAVKSCYSLPSENSVNVYCDVQYVSSGNTCQTASISSGSTASNSTPQNKTPTVNGVLNASPPPVSNPSVPSNGGGGTKGSQAANPSNSAAANPSSSAPPSPGNQQQINNYNNSSQDCPDCATEATQKQVLQAVTDTQGGVSQPDFNSGLTTDDIRNRLTNNNRIQSFFTVDSPSFSTQCPTFSIEVPMFNRTYQFSMACSLIEPYQSTIRLISTLGWTISAILMVMMA